MKPFTSEKNRSWAFVESGEGYEEDYKGKTDFLSFGGGKETKQRNGDDSV